MKIRSPLLLGLGGLVSTAAIRWWMDTLDYQVAYYDPALDPACRENRRPKLYIFWHEYILFPLFLRGHCNMAMLLSRHQDAEMLSHVARHIGFDFVRGSTGRGGVTALRELLRRSRRMHLTMTPDGPRGPRRRMAPGPIYLASRLAMPLVVMGFGHDRPWRVPGTWDRFAIPRPFTRARAVIGPEVFVPPDLDRQGLEHFRQRIERFQDTLTTEAEAWAASGARKTGQVALVRGPNQPVLRRAMYSSRSA